ncbi:MAG: ribonuclease Z [Candidatus Micrarchaeia archaeon]
MIRIVILGSGGAVPAPDRNLTSIAMRYEGDVYLFDCAEGTQRQMMKYGISYAKVKAIFISHLHGDHIFGIPGLVETLRLANSLKMIDKNEDLLIFGPSGTKKRIEELLGGDMSMVKVIEIDEGWKYEGKGKDREYSFTAFKTKHVKNSVGYIFMEKEAVRFDKERCQKLGIKGRMFKILQTKGEIEIKGKKITLADVTYSKPGKKIVYTGDTAYMKDIAKHAKGADILIHEATLMEDERAIADETNHSTALDAARIAKEAGVKHLVLFHISNRNKNLEEIKAEAMKEFDNVSVAYDSMEILI